jgi:photoactive yellow protein
MQHFTCVNLPAKKHKKRACKGGVPVATLTIDFDAPDLAKRIEELSQYELDRLPFGVILLDGEGIVQFYSQTEARQSGYTGATLGQNFFAISRCFGGDDFRGRIMRAREEGIVDLEFGWPGDFADPKRELRIRVQSARARGVWIFISRE